MAEAKRGPSKARPMSDKAYDALYTAIVSCELAPGVWMKASEVSELLGVGRTPTLQALMRLEAAGFTKPAKRKGWQVTPVTLQSVHDIMEAFRLVAPGMAMLVARNATEEQIGTLRKLVLAWAPGVPRSEAEPDHSVHPIQYLAEISGNPMVKQMAGGAAAHFERIMNFALRNGAFVAGPYVRWRDATFDAFAARDEKRARDAMLKLLDNGELELTRVLQNAQSIRSIPIDLERAG